MEATSTADVNTFDSTSKPALKTLPKKPTTASKTAASKPAAKVAAKPAVKTTTHVKASATSTPAVKSRTNPFGDGTKARPSSASDTDYTKVGTGVRPTICSFIAERKWTDAEIIKKTTELVNWNASKSRVEMNREAMNAGKRETLGFKTPATPYVEIKK